MKITANHLYGLVSVPVPRHSDSFCHPWRWADVIPAETPPLETVHLIADYAAWADVSRDPFAEADRATLLELIRRAS